MIKPTKSLMGSLVMALALVTVHGADPTSASSGAKSKLSIAVTALEGRGLAEGEASTLTDALASHLINTGAFRVMERGKMDLILKEQGFQQSGACTDEACIVEMGQLLGVDHMVTGSIGKVGKTYSVNIRMIHVATGEIVRTISKYYKGEIDGLLTEVMPIVADEFAANRSSASSSIAAAQPPAPAPAPAPVAAPARRAAPAASTATVPAAPVKSQPVKDKEQVNPKKGGHPVILAVVGILLVGGAVTAFIIMNNKTDKGDESEETGTVEVSWQGS